MPRITAPTVVENRELRREALMGAAADLLRRDGTFTMSVVAREVGLSRSAVYEYYDSAPDLIADVVVAELTAWRDWLVSASSPGATPRERVQLWIGAVLAYVADGRHALLRAAGSAELPPSRRADVTDLHQSLITPLADALADSGTSDPGRQARYVWAVVEVAIGRIENAEATPAEESRALLSFIDAALGGPEDR